MILVDSNVFMYAAGATHSNKASSVAFLEAVASGKVDAATDAEVLQEVLHRYRSIKRWTDGRALYDLIRRIVPNVIPITAEVVDEARKIFGSLARGERHEESDVDVAVEIDGLTNAEGREVGYFTGDLLTDYGVVISAFAVSTERMEHLRNRERAIALEIDRDGVPL